MNGMNTKAEVTHDMMTYYNAFEDVKITLVINYSHKPDFILSIEDGRLERA